MKAYKNRTSTSCVYDAFEAAGLPTEKYMLDGVLAADVIALLQKHGYKIYGTDTFVSNSELQKGFFVMWDTKYSKRDYGHIEYHTNLEWILSASPYEIGLIAVKG